MPLLFAWNVSDSSQSPTLNTYYVAPEYYHQQMLPHCFMKMTSYISFVGWRRRIVINKLKVIILNCGKSYIFMWPSRETDEKYLPTMDAIAASKGNSFEIAKVCELLGLIQCSLLEVQYWLDGRLFVDDSAPNWRQSLENTFVGFLPITVSIITWQPCLSKTPKSGNWVTVRQLSVTLIEHSANVLVALRDFFLSSRLPFDLIDAFLSVCN